MNVMIKLKSGIYWIAFDACELIPRENMQLKRSLEFFPELMTSRKFLDPEIRQILELLNLQKNKRAGTAL